MGGRRPPRRVVAPRRVDLEWLGFRDGGVLANLTTSVLDFELVPPAAADGIGVAAVTVLRVVGTVGIGTQAGVLTATRASFGIVVSPTGEDQTSDLDWSPGSTDVDALDERGVMFWWSAAKANTMPTVAADFDQVIRLIDIDIKTKRRMQKRDRLVCRLVAGSNSIVNASINLRVLTRSY